ncbi:ribonuclease H-like domain-containing protein [Tanacetum coccineum]
MDFKIKYKSNGEIDRYNTRLVAQGFNQKEVIDYGETFSPVVKMVTLRCLLNLVVPSSWPVFRCLLNLAVLSCWPVFQLDVNNAFLYGDLNETVYMKLLEGYYPSGDNKVCMLKNSLYGLKQALRQWNAKLTSTLIENSFSQSKSDYSLYTKSDKGVFLALLLMWMILSLLVSISKIDKFKVFLKSKFVIKDLWNLKYFLSIEVIDTHKRICLNQRKYVLDLSSEYGMFACKPAKTPLMTKIAISNEATVKKQNTLCKSSTEAKYRALASVTSEVIWILKILKDLKCEKLLPVSLYRDGNSAIKIAANPVFNERTKHLKIDLHFVREIFLSGVVKNVKVDSINQIADILTKGLDASQHKELVEKLGMVDIYQAETKRDVEIVVSAGNKFKELMLPFPFLISSFV